MESYLKYTLGLHVSIRTWNDSNTLPDELKREKEYSLLEICGITCLIITVREVDFQLSVFERECEELHKYCKYPFVLCFDRITSYQRKCLIESGQSFVVPNNQLYMPFLGIALQEHFKAQPIAGTQLTAMAQYILLFFLYEKTNAYYSKMQISQSLGISLMNVSRGVQELEELGLVETRKKGRSSMVCTNYDTRTLYDKASPYLRDPVQKRLYVKTESWLDALPRAGEEAAVLLGAAYSKKNCPVRAIEKRIFLEQSDRITVVDPAWDTRTEYLELEVWRYDPVKFAHDSIVDSFSLALSFKGELDEAVKLNINKLLM